MKKPKIKPKAKKKHLQENLISAFTKSPLPGSNQRPTDYKSVALPAELKRPT